MNPESYKRVVALFRRACQLEPAARDRFLEHECGHDAELRAGVDAMQRRELNRASDSCK